MNINLAAIYLETSKENEWSQFLGSLFDIGVENEDEEKFFFIDGLKFVLRKIGHGGKKKSGMTSFPFINIEFNSFLELQNLRQKVELYNYSKTDKINIQSLGKEALSFQDPDGRVWKFTCIRVKQSVNGTYLSSPKHQ